MKRFFSSTYKYEKWIEIEKLYIRYFLERKFLDPEKSAKIFDTISVTPYEFLSNVSEKQDEFKSFKQVILSKSFHLDKPCFKNGLSHSNLVDISNVLLIKEWSKEYLDNLYTFLEQLKDLAFKYKYLVQIGRTHGVHAEPTSFGHKFAVLYSDLSRYLDLIFNSLENLESVYVDWSKLNNPELGLEIQRYITQGLGLRSGFIDKPFCSRGRYVDFLSSVNAVSQLIAKLMMDLTVLFSESFGEVEFPPETFSDLQDISVYSKSMDNSFDSYSSAVNQLNTSRWFKLEEKYLLDILKCSTSILMKSMVSLGDMKVNEQNLNKSLSNISVYSQLFMMYLLRKTGYDRAEVLGDVRDFLCKSNGNKVNFKHIIKNSEKYGRFVNLVDIENLTNPNGFFNNIDEIYDSIFSRINAKNSVKRIVLNEQQLEFHISKLAVELNLEYANERSPVSIISFSERTLVFLGKLLLKCNFPMVVNTFPAIDKDEEIFKLDIDESAIKSKRVLIIDYFLDFPEVIEDFCVKLRDTVFFRDIKICTLIKFDSESGLDQSKVDFYGVEEQFSDFYVGFGKKGNGTDEFGRNLPYIAVTF